MTENYLIMYRMGTEESRKVLKDLKEHYQHQYKLALSLESKDAAALSMQEHVDELMEKTRLEVKKPISCKLGCSACCNTQVAITEHEARLILQYAKSENIEINQARLIKQSKADSLKGWESFRPRDRKCVFLSKERTCMIYKVRPMICRKYFVVSDPSLCDTVAHPGAEVLRINSKEAEALVTGVWEATPSGQMAKMLLNQKE